MFIKVEGGVNSQGAGGTQIFSYIRRLGSFLGLKILSFNLGGGGVSEKMNIFWV